jgi:hypothetical protein
MAHDVCRKKSSGTRDARSAAVQHEHLLTHGVAEIKKCACGANVMQRRAPTLAIGLA